MKSRVKVSILVPICNVEKYLAECLDSLVNQTLKEIEIICINDGSTDHSLDIIKKYAKNDKRIVVIDKKNSGYGDSMNKGLEKAAGEYIGIVESDDFADEDMFEVFYDTAVKHKADVVKSNFYEYFGDKQQDRGTSNLFLPDEVGKVINPAKNRHIFYQQPSIWSALYNNDFLKENDIKFLPSPGASYQDAGFNFKVWASAKRAYFIERAFLHYRQDNTNSSVKSSGKVYCVKDEYDEVEHFLIERKKMKEYGSTLAMMRFSSYIWNMHRLTRKAALEFAETVTKDYQRIKQEGYLNKEELKKADINTAQNIAVRHPKLYVFLRPLHTLKNAIKPALSKFLQTISPVYKQRLETINLLNTLQVNQAKLENKIQKIKEKK